MTQVIIVMLKIKPLFLVFIQTTLPRVLLKLHFALYNKELLSFDPKATALYCH